MTARPGAFPGGAIDAGPGLDRLHAGSALVNHGEGETGSIEVGKGADLAVLDRDMRAGRRAPWARHGVVATVVAGRVVAGEL